MTEIGALSIATRAWVWAADSSPVDPTGFIPSLGIGGAVALVLLLWIKDLSKQRDKLFDQITDLLPDLRESTAAHKASTKATEEMIEMLRYRWPSPDGSRRPRE